LKLNNESHGKKKAHLEQINKGNSKNFVDSNKVGGDDTSMGQTPALVDTIKDAVDQISFYGNKILKADKEIDSTWFESYRQLIKAHLDFIASRCEDFNL
jgi:hypothetical protein